MRWLLGALPALASLGLLVTPASAATAAPSPATSPAAAERFTGRWLLDGAASDLGKGRKPPRVREDSLRADGPWLDVRSWTVRADGDTVRLAFRYHTSGEAVNQLMGQEIHTRGTRQGAVLRFVSVTRLFFVRLEVRERWAVSTDRGTFTIERDSDSPLGKERQKLVFRRASAASGRE